MGLERLREALEANDWEGADELGEDATLEGLDEDDEEAEGSMGFGIDAAEMEEEMAGMKRAIYGGGLGEEDEEDANQDQEVEKLQAMMLKMQAVRGKWPVSSIRTRLTQTDMGADLPEVERKKLAAKAVSEVMKTL
jgi:hypothetical protein